MNKNKWLFIIGGISVLFLLGTGFFGGWHAHKEFRPCPTITHDTITLYDTTTHIIINDVHHYHSKIDTIIYRDTIFKDVDTAAILKDYYALHVYDRNWLGMEGKDSLLTVSLKDTITENKSIGNIFKYKILRPQSIINNTTDNTITYNSYLYAGLTIPISKGKMDEISFDGIYAFPKAYLGGSWQPYTNTFAVKAGMKILKFKQKK